jgi:aryl-alcohol dehydrogenase-like predicted oxidoreductase
MMRAVEASLRRLRTDYIDLYQAHWDDRDTPLEEALRGFDDLVRQVKVRYVGASNHVAWRLTRALWESDRHGYVRYECVQPKYNLVVRDEYERELEPLCLEQGVGVIPYSSLASGFLTGKYRRGGDLPATARAPGVQKAYMTDRGFAVLAAVDKVAAGLGATPAQVALSWLAHRPGITAPIASATSVTQLKELIGGVELVLDAEARGALDQAESALVDSPVAALEQKEMAAILRKLLAELKPPQGGLLADFFLHGLSYEEMARKHDVAIGSVGVYLKRGLESIRQTWKDRGE